MQPELLILQLTEFGDDGDRVHRYHAPGRQLSRLPGVMTIDADPQHRLLRPLIETADVLVLAAVDTDMFPLFERRRAADRITVFEANDYFYDVHPWNSFSGRWLDRRVQDNFQNSLKLADAVQTSTPELVRRWRERTTRPIVAFPNQVYDVPPLAPRVASTKTRPLTIGWGGSVGHLGDWYHLAPVLERWLLAHPDVHLSVMGHDFAKTFLGLPPERCHFQQAGPMPGYLEFLQTLDIGLAPLLPTDYNRCRSDVKFLEYASQGVAGIYSDLEPYRASVVHGQTGLLYKTSEEFVQCLDRLAGDAALRASIRENAHNYVAEERRLEDHVGERLEFYRSLLGAPTDRAAVPDEILAAAVHDERYLQLRPGQAEATLREAILRPSDKQTVEMLLRLVEAYPNYLLALQQLGRVLNDMQDHASALRYLEWAHALDATSGRTKGEIGRALFRLGDSVRAQQWLHDAISVNPYSQHSWRYFLNFLRLTGANDGPQWTAKAQESHPADYGLILCGIELYPWPQAVVRLQELLEIYAPTFAPDEMPEATKTFGEAIRKIACQQIDAPVVLQLLAKACEVFPDSAQMANLWGQALYLVGRHEESQAQFVRGLELRRTALTYRSEFLQEDAVFHYGEFAEHIETVKTMQLPKNLQ